MSRTTLKSDSNEIVRSHFGLYLVNGLAYPAGFKDEKSEIRGFSPISDAPEWHSEHSSLGMFQRDSAYQLFCSIGIPADENPICLQQDICLFCSQN